MTLSKHQIDNLLTAISSSLKDAYDYDKYLIDNKVHERTIVGRFAIYFQQKLNQIDYSDFHLDIEYNRDHSDPKRTKNFPKGTFPDVIVHKRGSNDKNLCIIEFKTWWNPNTDKDIKKLKEFTDEEYKYKYGIGFSITLNRNCPPVIQMIEKGRLINNIQRSEVYV